MKKIVYLSLVTIFFGTAYDNVEALAQQLIGLANKNRAEQAVIQQPQTQQLREKQNQALLNSIVAAGGIEVLGLTQEQVDALLKGEEVNTAQGKVTAQSIINSFGTPEDQHAFSNREEVTLRVPPKVARLRHDLERSETADKLAKLQQNLEHFSDKEQRQIQRISETSAAKGWFAPGQVQRIDELYNQLQQTPQRGENSLGSSPLAAAVDPKVVRSDSDTSGDEDLARALQEEEEAAVAAQSALQVDVYYDRSAQLTPAYMDRMQEVGPNELVCPVLHSYSGQISAMPYVIRDVKEDTSTAEFRRRISSKLADLNDLATVQCALTIQPNRAFRTDRDEQVHPMLFRPQWGFDKGTDVDPALGAPKNKAMLCPSVLSVYEPNKGWRAIDFRGGPAVSFHPAAGGVTAISPDSHNLGLSPEDESCAVLYHTNYPGDNKTIYGVILVLSQSDLGLYQEMLMSRYGLREALMATSLVRGSEELQQILGLRE